MKAKLWQALQDFYWTRIAPRWQRANHALRGTDRFYAVYVAEAEKKGDRQEAEARHSEWSAVRQEEQDEVDRLETIYWQKKAARHRVPVPSYGHKPYWEDGGRGYRLTIEGIDFIETRIYEKRKRRWEFWFSAIPTVTGLIGALIGLLAIWRH
jgi:hypothetical protein